MPERTYEMDCAVGKEICHRPPMPAGSIGSGFLAISQSLRNGGRGSNANFGREF
jgi:hypothetical protein